MNTLFHSRRGTLNVFVLLTIVCACFSIGAATAQDKVAEPAPALDLGAIEAEIGARRDTILEAADVLKTDAALPARNAAEEALQAALTESEATEAALREAAIANAALQAALSDASGAEAPSQDVTAIPPEDTVVRPESEERGDAGVETALQLESEALTRAVRAAEANQALISRTLTDLAATQRLDSMQAAVERRRTLLEEARLALETEQTSTTLVALREQVRALRDEASATITPLEASRDTLANDLDRLGAAPAADAAPEPPEIASERARLSQQLAREDAIIRQAELNIAEASRLLSAIATQRRSLFYTDLLERAPSPLSAAAWSSTLPDLRQDFAAVKMQVTSWTTDRNADNTLIPWLIGLAAALIGTFALGGPIRRRVRFGIIDGLERGTPTPGRRAAIALVRVGSRVAMGLVTTFLILTVLDATKIVRLDGNGLDILLWQAAIAFIAAEAVVTAVFSPRSPGWGMVTLTRPAAITMRSTLLVCIGIFLADRFVASAVGEFRGATDLTWLQSTLTAAVLGVAYLRLSSRSAWQGPTATALAAPAPQFDEESESEPISGSDERPVADESAEPVQAQTDGLVLAARRPTDLWRTLRLGSRLLAIFILVSLCFGYVALAHYAATRVFLLGALAAAGLFVRLLIRHGIQLAKLASDGAAESTVSALHDPTRSPPEFNEEREESSERFLFYWLGVLVDICLVLAFLPFAALILGADWADVRAVVINVLVGFEVGNVRISIAKILGAFGLFFVISWVFKGVQRLAETKLLPRTRLDEGLRGSLKTLIGYAGLLVALLAAVSALGFKLANLAIIAGALSVGIGFGLQSIVNNFVSGLILLFERPIKVGDWVVTASGEGTVRKISVRSTEIETFDRAMVIVPNSELISSAVTNWTHKDKTGRLIIPVAVGYDTDVRKAIGLLEEAAREHYGVLRFPAPYVFFSDFGNDGLVLELRCIIRDVGNGLGIRTALRIAILDKLRAAGIEIPYPQRDIHLRTTPGSPVDDTLETAAVKTG